ncbi:hypothetical protein ASPZODRAFT_16637 [Penicilliopsis zonata CBS 506.65]|uniref:Citrate synthase n=1 Tax=Penicilliopsis zonata CBS 506.65 TaxID=1073090 RepID=A0A1L9SFU8_9EURO|nr:hypothetical protein ASPZODRAFT_16637 [Penicilliopsis zonata CBS 506.65]OJJ46042.1 hypothetical protein ASPZODRAFT_16637 [Penicilliopsis zonata CBS 506.65]
MSSGTLFVKDSRTLLQYEIPIRKNAILATDFKVIKAPSAGTDRADSVAGGLRIHDPGLQNTTVLESAISFSDHERNMLLFRGYSLEQLWECDFEDMLYLLVWGTLPNASQRRALSYKLAQQMLAVPDCVQKAISTLPKTTSPLPLMITGLAAYLASVPESIPSATRPDIYQTDTQKADQVVLSTVAAYAVVFGLVSCHRRSAPFAPASLQNTYLENLFTMASLISPSSKRPDPLKLSCFRRFALLNAEHGMALSVFSALVTASSLTDPLSCVISALAAAYGPLHFGATETAQRALREISCPEDIGPFIAQVKSGKRKLFGYGHRSYKGVDPRLRFIKSILEDLELDTSSKQMLEVSQEIERLASTDDWFHSRALYPNADFYGQFVFAGVGVDAEMIPAAMMAQRIMGVMAHWREYTLSRGKLFRPSHIYTGSADPIGKVAKIPSTSRFLNERAIPYFTLCYKMIEPQATASTPLLPKYSVFSNCQKRWIILTAALASSFSPFSANIYYPSLNSIAKDLHVSTAQINLTITSYMICQGLAPTFMGSLADQAGRRPAYVLCFSIYICGNLALALQRSYPALLALRAVQSCGSSGTVALASAVAADIITSAERGTYMGLASLGNILAPSLGPILGGLLSQYLGWQAVFWFLAIAAFLFFVPLLLFFPETCRAIVGDGSRLAPWWNRTLLDCIRDRRLHGEWEEEHTSNSNSEPHKIQIPNPLTTLRLLFHLPTGLILIANGIIFASYYAVTAGIPSRFKALYDLTDMQIGFSFIPLGVGSLTSTLLNGSLIDWNYRRLRLQAGLPVVSQDRKQDADLIAGFAIERARLQIGLPMTLLAAVAVAGYGVLMERSPPLFLALGIVFVISCCITAAYNVLNVLIVDLHYETPATAMATNNLVRCFLGAGATAAIAPMIHRWGDMRTYCLVAGMLAMASPLLIAVYLCGVGWRRQG